MLEPSQVTPSFGPGLTRREREVLTILATGAFNREIAEALYLSEKTVKQHVSNAMHKLGARNRTDLALMYVVATHDASGDPATVPASSAEQEMKA